MFYPPERDEYVTALKDKVTELLTLPQTEESYEAILGEVLERFHGLNGRGYLFEEEFNWVVGKIGVQAYWNGTVLW